MAFHIRITDTETGTVEEDAITDSIVLLYGAEEGIHGETCFHTQGRTLLDIVFAMDDVRDQLLDRNPILRMLYESREHILKETVSVDITALKRALGEVDE